MLTRRSILAGGSAAALAFSPLRSALAASSAGDPLRKLILINSLGSIRDGYGRSKAGAAAGDVPIGSEAEIADCLASGTTAINITLSAGSDFDKAMAEVRKYDAFVKAHSGQVMKILSADDIVEAKKSGKLGLIYGFQNSAMLGDDAGRVDAFADRGLRIIQLTYNDLNQLGAGSLVPTNDGLSAFGHEVIKRLNARNIIVDLSHSGRQICLDAARASARPIAITHTGCAALAANPRNKTDEELRLVAEKGGYVGIYFMPFLAPGRPFSSEDVAAHIDHAINVCGEDHVGIGTDHAPVDLGPLDKVKENYAHIVLDRRAKGISAPGEDPAILPYGTDLIGPDQYRVLFRTLEAKGYAAARIEKIFGQNFLRFARDIWV